MKQPKYYEKQGTSFLFSKRLNGKHGTFPLFDSKIKQKLSATTEAEASLEAATLAGDLDHLQRVCSKDSKNHPLSSRDMNRAAKTWAEVIGRINLEQVKHLSGKHTQEAMESKDALSRYIGEVADFFSSGKERLGPDGFEHTYWYSKFGDHLLTYLKEGEQAGSLADAVPIYLAQTNRSHQPETNKTVRDTKRYVDLFIAIAGEKSVEEIRRRDVDAYVRARLLSVKTTSVEREIAVLRAVWNKFSLVKDLKQQNPFKETSILGLGTDTVHRITPSLEETIDLLKKMELRWANKPSYVSALIAITALTGARLGEIWGLEPSDLQDDTLWIRPNATRSNLKTANSTRPFPVLDELRVWLERLFSSRKAGSANSASSACNKALTGYVMHGLRHGMKQRLVDVDAPLNVIEELQGWSSQRMSSLYGQNTARNSKTGFVRSVYAALMPRETFGNVIRLRRT